MTSWFLASFLLFFSIDGSFTRVGGTTTYCYFNPLFGIYEPMALGAWGAGVLGGGPLVKAHHERLGGISPADLDPSLN